MRLMGSLIDGYPAEGKQGGGKVNDSLTGILGFFFLIFFIIFFHSPVSSWFSFLYSLGSRVVMILKRKKKVILPDVPSSRDHFFLHKSLCQEIRSISEWRLRLYHALHKVLTSASNLNLNLNLKATLYQLHRRSLTWTHQHNAEI